jgi:hypothetical protein
MPIELKGSYIRVRVKSLKLFRDGTLRTLDVGAIGHTKQISGKLKKSGCWGVQSWLFHVQDVLSSRYTTKRILQDLGYWNEARRLASKW